MLILKFVPSFLFLLKERRVVQNLNTEILKKHKKKIFISNFKKKKYAMVDRRPHSETGCDRKQHEKGNSKSASIIETWDLIRNEGSRCFFFFEGSIKKQAHLLPAFFDESENWTFIARSKGSLETRGLRLAYRFSSFQRRWPVNS